MSILPTWSLNDGSGRSQYRDSLIRFLSSDTSYSQLNLYLYQVTLSGWGAISHFIRDWLTGKRSRHANVYCGLSNWLSEPCALEEMMRVLPRRVWVIKRGHGVFHPKALVFRAGDRAECFLGSNNLTHAGMFSNFEMGARLTIQETTTILTGKCSMNGNQSCDPFRRLLPGIC